MCKQWKLLTVAICIYDLDSGILYTFLQLLRQSDSAQTHSKALASFPGPSSPRGEGPGDEAK